VSRHVAAPSPGVRVCVEHTFTIRWEVYHVGQYHNDICLGLCASLFAFTCVPPAWLICNSYRSQYYLNGHSMGRMADSWRSSTGRSLLHLTSLPCCIYCSRKWSKRSFCRSKLTVECFTGKSYHSFCNFRNKIRRILEPYFMCLFVSYLVENNEGTVGIMSWDTGNLKCWMFTINI
jgi:hypothetical protein